MQHTKDKICILGAGESGVGAALLAQKQGYEVFVSDLGALKPPFRKELQDNNIRFEEARHTEAQILEAALVIKSPGIPDTAPIIKKIKEKEIPVISEIEFAARFTDATKICVTGSNGKTTTTLMTYHILKRSGLNVGLAGNVGKSFARQVAMYNHTHYVLELSSFQLDGMYGFKADVAVILNITPDHLDRYQNNFQCYVDSKFRITQNLTERDHLVYCSDDKVLLEEIGKRIIQAGLFPFSVEQKVETGGYLEEDLLHFRVGGEVFTMPVDELPLEGIHNTYNTLAAGITGKIMEIRNKDLRESLRSFQGVEHRLEQVATVRGVQFINDSKATNINSTWYALESMAAPTIWIVGGVDKGNDYGLLEDLVQEKVKHVICLGKDTQKLHEAFGGKKPLWDTQSMGAAVEKAQQLAEEGETVLLSPACASFDLFDNYEHRGRAFKAAIEKL